MLRLLTAIEAILAPHLARQCPNKALHIPNKNNCTHLAKSGHFVQELDRLGLWPILKAFHDNSIAGTSDRIMSFKDYDISDQLYNLEHCDNARIACKSLLQEVVLKTPDEQLGRCLNCVKKGIFSKQDGNCQARFSDCCKLLHR